MILAFQSNMKAETWDEPWQKEIIQKSEHFILGQVIKMDILGAHIAVKENFGNKRLSDTLLINGFSLLDLKSSSGQGLHFYFKEGQKSYFLLTERSDGHYAIPTPTSGFALLDEENHVNATYRHSYHVAYIPKDIYELTYKAIWNYYHDKDGDTNTVVQFINEQIDKNPAGFEEDEVPTFYLQHAALESAYLLDISLEFNRIKKFATSENFHSRVSAVQLMSLHKTKDTKEFLLEYIQSDSNENFDKVIAIRSLKTMGGRKYRKKLLAIADTLSDENTGFGGNIMDPRVATSFPSPREAVTEEE